MRLTLLTLLPGVLALAVLPEKRASPRYHPSPHSLFSHPAVTKTVTVTTTTTVTIPGSFPTANATFPNATAITTTSSVDLAPITLITLSTSETEAAAEETSGLAPITLITLPSETDAVATPTVDEGVAPTPNDIAPITLIDISAATPI